MSDLGESRFDERRGDQPQEREELERALDELAELSGDPNDLVSIAQAVEKAQRNDPGNLVSSWPGQLAMAAGIIGLRATVIHRSVARAIQLVKAGAPLAIYSSKLPTPSRVGGFLVISDRRGARVKVSGPDFDGKAKWISRRSLSALLDENDPELTWVLIESATPCESMRDQHGHGHGMSPLKRALKLVWPERRDIWVVMVFAIAFGVLMLAVPIAVENLVNTVAFGNLRQPLVILSILLLGCLGFAAALRAIQTFVVEVIQRRIFLRVVADLAYRLPRLHADVSDRDHAPELVNRFFDVMTVQKSAASLLLDGLSLILQSVIGLIVLASYHPFLLGFDIVLILAIGLIVFTIGRGAVSTSIDESVKKYAVAGWLEEMARHPTAFKFSGGREHALHRADALAREYLFARRRHFAILFRQITFSLALEAIALTSLLGLGGWLVIEGQLTLGQLVAAELIVSTVVGSLAKFGKHFESYYNMMAAVDKLGVLIDLPLERSAGSQISHSSDGMTVAFREVDFAYNGHRPVLTHASFEIASGESVAITGASGSGKTTIVDLLYGLRSATSGYIELDGLDIRDLHLESLRSDVAVVRTEEIVPGSIEENVRFSRPGINAEEIREALDLVELLDTVRDLHDGLQTQLTTGGAPLSQSQSRRLMIARAIVARPRLLILDESLGALDDDVRARIVSSMCDKRHHWTLILITQRPDIMVACDRCLTLSDGQVIEGTSLRSEHESPS
ncbi:putative ABC transporter ATP-binding protein [Planctomycetes bacterium Pan216]|uniref:Putative ABC transporter ATP-binding protein n=1 Tax=Kolteria novifilia TaxID=2527975 RepID=A0A518AZC0_9BACT|nr:putative ABC transporter ATP-binding protein [Planctomycetes bacterium Pan216]